MFASQNGMTMFAYSQNDDNNDIWVSRKCVNLEIGPHILFATQYLSHSNMSFTVIVLACDCIMSIDHESVYA